MTDMLNAPTANGVKSRYRDLLTLQRSFARLRTGIASRQCLRVKDIERLRLLGLRPLGPARVFRVKRVTDEILAVWCGPGEERPAPHWSEIASHLAQAEQAIDATLAGKLCETWGEESEPCEGGGTFEPVSLAPAR